MPDKYYAQSSIIYDNLEVVEALRNAFVDAIGEGQVPSFAEWGSPAPHPDSETESLVFQDDTFKLVNRNQAGTTDVTHIFLAYLAPYARGLTVKQAYIVVGEQPSFVVWNISDDGQEITKQSFKSELTERTYDAGLVRDRNPELDNVDLRPFNPDVPSRPRSEALEEPADPGHPEPPEPSYPEPPEVVDVEASGRSVSSPRKIHITVKYTARDGVEPRQNTVTFRIKNGEARLQDIDDPGYLQHKSHAIIAATRAVRDHPSVNSVKNLEDLLADAEQYIKKSRFSDDD